MGISFTRQIGTSQSTRNPQNINGSSSTFRRESVVRIDYSLTAISGLYLPNVNSSRMLGNQ
jgi:hypothetical protein